MLRISTLLVLIAQIALADQLALNPPEVTKKAVQAIRPGSIMISYCSRCTTQDGNDTDARVEVWRVLRVLNESREPTKDVPEKLSYTVVIGERLFVSLKPYGEGKYHEPLAFRRVLPSEPADQRIVTEDIDLAYVYTSSGTNRFRCLGKQLGLDCDVAVPQIVLPDAVFKAIEVYTDSHGQTFNVAGE